MIDKSSSSNAIEIEVKEILSNVNHPTAKYLRNLLFKYNLDLSFIHDVLQEAYIRSTRSEQNIVNAQAWLKVVSLNIIRELKRNQQRYILQDIEDIHSHLSQLTYTDSCESDDIFIKDQPIDLYKNLLAKSWLSLSSEQRFILTMRIIEDKSWKEVAEAISLINCKHMNESNVRKQGNRALNALKKQFVVLK